MIYYWCMFQSKHLSFSKNWFCWIGVEIIWDMNADIKMIFMKSVKRIHYVILQYLPHFVYTKLGLKIKISIKMSMKMYSITWYDHGSSNYCQPLWSFYLNHKGTTSFQDVMGVNTIKIIQKDNTKFLLQYTSNWSICKVYFGHAEELN